MHSPRITIRDVARSANVAISTVSRAMNGSPDISAATVERVMESARALGYTADPIGRALRNRSTSSLGLVIPNIANPFFPSLIQAVEIAAKHAGWTMLLADAQDDIDVEREALELLVQRRVDAILISPCHRTRSTPAVMNAAKSTSIVQIDRRCTATLAHVGVDQQAAMVAVLNHLLAAGRRHIAFIGVDSGEWAGYERALAFRNWASINIPTNPVYLGVSSADWGRAAARRALEEFPQIDAIVCSNDLLAVGAMFELEELGIDVPGRVAVTGFDNTMMSIVSRPTLTTVNQPVTEMGERAIAIANSEEEELPSEYLLAGELVIRQSSQLPVVAA